MRVFVYSTHNLWQSHHETDLEIIQRHLDEGDEVFNIVCKGHFASCDTNVHHEITTCLKCRDVGNCGRKMLSGAVGELAVVIDGIRENTQAQRQGLSYRNMEELLALRIDNFDLGYAVASSVISKLREPEPDLKRYEGIVNNFLQSALDVYYSALQYFDQYKPDLVYVFNGRFAQVKAILRAAQACNIRCLVHERGSNIHRYSLYENTTPHDRKYMVSRMIRHWHDADGVAREEEGARFYIDRAGGVAQSWFSYVDDQRKGLLPADWDKSKRNVIIYNSSEDEFASIGNEWKNELYTSQNEGVERLVKDCMKYPDIHFYFRIHPNLRNVHNSQTEGIAKLSAPNLTVISANDPVSTYELLFNADKIVAFGSTVGIEAVYWGKPSIQLGKSYYEDLGGTYVAKSHEDAVGLIGTVLVPKDKTAALIYGYYMNSYGIPFKYYKATGFISGTYKGVNLHDCESGITGLYRRVAHTPLLHKAANYIAARYRVHKYKLWF